MAAPSWFHKYLQADVYELLWEKDPTFDIEDTGTDSNAYKWIKNHTAPTPPRDGAILGIGLLDWPSHVKAMQVKWLLKYLDASDSTWKTTLDCWFARTSLGRAAILAKINPKILIQSMRGNIALPKFWRQALDALHELPLTQIQQSQDGAMSQPIWDNRHYPPPPITNRLRDRWESLQLTVAHNRFSDREGLSPFTKDGNAQYIDTGNEYHYYKNTPKNNEQFLNSWDTIVTHYRKHIIPFEASKETPARRSPQGEPEAVAITTDGDYILYLDGVPHKGIRNTLGEIAIGEVIQGEPMDIDPSPPTRWGKGYKGPRRETFPLPDEYALDAHETPLDATTVKILTHTFSLQNNHKQHPCLAAWTKRLAITPKQWLIIASRYNNSVLTPRDYHLHFKHITHRRIGTNNRFADQSSICLFATHTRRPQYTWVDAQASRKYSEL
jgi:ubiquitin